MTPQETDPDCLWVSRSLVGQRWPAVWFGALSATLYAWDLVEDVTTVFIACTIVWSHVKQQGGGTVLLINRKLD